MSRIPLDFWMFGFIQNLHVQKTILFWECWVYTKCACSENMCFFVLFLFLVVGGGYAKFACPENQFIFGCLGLHKICMSIIQLYFWIVGFTQNLHVQKTNLFLDCWCYTKFACPENICFGNVGVIANLHVQETFF